MYNDQLNIIDFSQGIKDTEIQHNFNALLNQVKRERLSIAGYGVSKGLDLTISDFNVTVSEGTVVDVDGNEIYLDSKTIAIDKPELILDSSTLQIGDNGLIQLPNIPYATTRITTSEYDQINSGIKIVDSNNANRVIPVISISSNVLNVDAKLAQQMVDISYSYTNKRYDTIYIDNAYTIQRAPGITSPSPSVYIPKNYKFILGFVEVMPMYMDPNLNKINAICTLKEEMDKFRNIYTDENNNLYICGTPFEDMQIVHMQEPVNPIENTLYYDSVANKLKVWRTIDGIAGWVNVNDTSIIPVLETRLWKPFDVDYPDDMQTFIFDSKNDLNMKFIPGKNELELFIDQSVVFFDQFTEVTLADAKTDPIFRNLLKTKYNYTDDEIDSTDDLYENIGIGFKLGEPLDVERFIEARTTHRVNENPVKVRFQRSATFVKTKAVVYDGTNAINTDVPYRVGECQLDVYAAGKRLDVGLGFTEGTDLTNPVSGQMSKQFTLTASNIANGDIISYKITSNIYSYDDISQILDDIKDTVDNAVDNVDKAVTEVNTFVNTSTIAIGNMQNTVDTLNKTVGDHSDFINNIATNVANNIPSSITAWIPKGIINQKFTKDSSLVLITGINPGDFIVAFDISVTTGNNVLERNVDYDIKKDPNSGNIYFEFITAVPDGHDIYVIGLNF